MKRKTIKIDKKIENHLTVNGQKYTSEKILLKSLKQLQKDSKKQSQKLLKLAIILSSPIFRLHTLTQKKRKKKKGKEIPAFISKTYIKTSLAIKIILSTIKKKDLKKTYLDFEDEILVTAQGESSSIKSKNANQEQILTKKHLFRYYRWN